MARCWDINRTMDQQYQGSWQFLTLGVISSWPMVKWHDRNASAQPQHIIIVELLTCRSRHLPGPWAQRTCRCSGVRLEMPSFPPQAPAHTHT
eukprot:scaffold119101_cov20-Tisochrysis_lutea.AAC.2